MKTGRNPKALRPTTGKVREALFNILRGGMKDAVFLDLYAGTGAVGIEAIRQGASEVIFVEAGKTNTADISVALNRLRFT
ncbi:MAG: 16S rRNA (guanine(966)-N(2))-methyltransferase RsmD, partial [Nitrospiraceae bacterium]